MKKPIRKKLFIAVPLCLLILCGVATGIYFAIAGRSIDRTDMMLAQEYTDTAGIVLPYRIYVPEGYDAAEQYPLVLYLHGSGERGSDNRAQTSKNSVMQTLLGEENLEKYPCIVLAPQCPEERWWGDENIPALMGLLEQMKADYSVDANRIYITGISMGGYGTWKMLEEYPFYFAAAVPICGGGEPGLAPLFRKVPIWVFHGAKDSVVSPQSSRDMVEALQKADGDVKYTEYPRVNHNSWEKAYREAELFPWLFAQQKGG